MITTDDLARIRKVIREEVTTEVKDSTRTLDHEIRMSRMQLQNEISELDDRMKNVEIRVDEVSNNLDKLNKTLDKVHKSLKKEIKYTTHILDKENMRTRSRVKRLEDHLGLSSNNN